MFRDDMRQGKVLVLCRASYAFAIIVRPNQ
jgi:hypothetical protein